jgi:hypothetical protein
MAIMKHVITAILGALLLTSAELNDTPQGATPFQDYGSGTLDYSGDPEWFRIQRNHVGGMNLDIMTGWGALCSCPQGDPFIVELELYDMSGQLILSYVGVTAGFVQVPLSGLPLGQPVWMRISGVTVGSLGWSNYQLMVF